jgi:hypothetical protein
MRFLTWVFWTPVFAVALVLAVANRDFVLISFDPFDPLDPAFGVRLPLYAALFGCLLLGMIIGGAAALMARPKK